MKKNNVSFEKLGLINSVIPRLFVSKVIGYGVLKTLRRPVSICVVFVSDKEIKKVNNRFRKKNKVTTCLSFPLGLNDLFEDKSNIGDIFINIDRIKKCSQNFTKELAFNLIHSYLHLIGFSHVKDRDAKIMEEQESKILKGIYENFKKSS